MRNARYIIDKFLQPGEFAVGDAKYRFHTLLGSCVSITLWHPERKFGAMSHFMLSHRKGAARGCRADTNVEWDARYGEEALWLMLRELRRANVPPEECEGKIFGGGDMFPGLSAESLGVGRQNGEAARRLLVAHDISIVSESLFGVGHRQIIFDIDTGHVWARQVEPLPGKNSIAAA
jgi:chemotaxis protein CheD